MQIHFKTSIFLILPLIFITIYYQTDLISENKVVLKKANNEDVLNAEKLCSFHRDSKPLSLIFKKETYLLLITPITIKKNHKLFFSSNIYPVSGSLYKYKNKILLSYKSYFTDKNGDSYLKKYDKKIIFRKELPLNFLFFYSLFVLCLFLVKRIVFEKKTLFSVFYKNNEKHPFYFEIVSRILNEIEHDLLLIKDEKSTIKTLTPALRLVTSLKELEFTNVAFSKITDLPDFLFSLITNLWINKKKNFKILNLCQEKANVNVPAPILETILYNLLDNALQATKELPPKEKKIICKIFTDPKAIILEIKNKTIIKETFSEKLIEVGFSTKENGSGLGLNIIRELCARQGIFFSYNIVDSTFCARLRFKK